MPHVHADFITLFFPGFQEMSLIVKGVVLKSDCCCYWVRMLNPLPFFLIYVSFCVTLSLLPCASLQSGSWCSCCGFTYFHVLSVLGLLGLCGMTPHWRARLRFCAPMRRHQMDCFCWFLILAQHYHQ